MERLLTIAGIAIIVVFGVSLVLLRLRLRHGPDASGKPHGRVQDGVALCPSTGELEAVEDVPGGKPGQLVCLRCGLYFMPTEPRA